MQFSIDIDNGEVISGWVVLENPGEIPSLIVEWNGGHSVELTANINRPDLKDVGLHATGMAGFQIDGSIIPDLSEVQKLRIREKETNIQIYARYDISRNIDKKVFLFLFSTLRQKDIIRSLTRKFGSSYLNLERYPYETTNAILNSVAMKSVVCIGQPSFVRYAGALEAQQFFRAALLRDPFEELAEKLLLLRLSVTSTNESVYNQHLSGLLPLRSFAQRLNFNDERELRQAFRSLTPEERDCIFNPVTKTLACEVNESPERRHVGVALDNLSSMDLVGTMSDYDKFQSLFNTMLDANAINCEYPAVMQPVDELSRRLTRISTVTQLIEHDLALYSYAEEAVRNGISEATAK